MQRVSEIGEILKITFCLWNFGLARCEESFRIAAFEQNIFQINNYSKRKPTKET